MFKRIFALVSLVFLASTAIHAQCHIDVILPLNDTTICMGDSIYLGSDGTCNYLMNNSFDNGTIGTGWSSTAANPVFNNPCGNGPVGAHLWVGTTASSSRTLVTNAYNVSLGGCVIKWWMRYGRVQGSGACEDPDATNEGVHLQYSTNNGATWTDFPGPNISPVGTNTTTGPYANVTTVPGSGGYWTPVSSSTAQASSSLYFWHRYENVVPAVAATTNTKFRWAQLANSSAGWDAWGIDEVQIVCPNYGQNVSWSHGPTALVPPAPVSPTTTTSYIVAIFDSLGHFDMDTVVVNVTPVPAPDLGSDTVICDYPGNQALFDAGGGYSNYSWNTGATTQTISPNQTGPYSVTVTDGNCHGVDTVMLTMSPAPTADAGQDVEICFGDTALLSAQAIPNANYLWSDNTTNISTAVSPTTSQSFSVTVSIGQNCQDSDTVHVKVNPLPTADAGPDQEICKGDSVVVQASGGVSYVWNTGDQTASIIQFPNVNNTYVVTVTDANGCKETDEMEVKINMPPNISIQASKDSLCLGDSTVLTATGATSYNWSTGATGAALFLVPSGTSTYRVFGIDDKGCENSASKVIFAEDCSTFFMPNSFTPNGDGLNDIFVPVGDFGGILDYQLYIYNRQGQLVFQSNEITKGWDGKYDDEDVPGAAYAYIVSYKTVWGKEFSKRGTVTVIR